MRNAFLPFVLIITLFTISFSSCNKTNEDDKPPYLFKVRFGEGGSGVVFLSDKNGDIISEKAWKSNTIITFYLPENYSPPYTNFTVTAFKTDEIGLYKIKSYHDIIPGTYWKYFRNPRLFRYGYSMVIPQNIPYNDSYILASEDHFLQSHSPLFERIGYPYFENSFDMILVLGVNDGQNKYMKIDNALNQSYIDLSNMESSVEAIVNTETCSGELSYNLYGVSYDNPCSTDRYLIWKDENINPIMNQLKIKYPPDMFELFKTHIREEDGLYSWNQYTYGGIPSKVIKINADIDLLKTSPTDCELSTGGTYDYWSSTWRHEDENDNLFYWYVQGPKGQTKYTLPKIPELIKQNYPNLSRELFAIKSSYVCDYEGISSFQELNHKYYALGDCYYEDPPSFWIKYVYIDSKEKKEDAYYNDYSMRQ